MHANWTKDPFHHFRCNCSIPVPRVNINCIHRLCQALQACGNLKITIWPRTTLQLVPMPAGLASIEHTYLCITKSCMKGRRFELKYLAYMTYIPVVLY